MRINCPNCGKREVREFTYLGDARLLVRPNADAGPEAFHEYVNLRDNPASAHHELWHHAFGCRAWLVVERCITSHEITSVQLAREHSAEAS